MNGRQRRFVAVFALTFAACGASFARGGGSHGHHHGGHHHGHFSAGFYFAGWPYYGAWGYGWPYYYPPYYYPSYYYPPFAYGPSYAQTFVEQQDPSWYYCAARDGYYPYVTECPDGAWSRVSPQPPPGSDNRGSAVGAPAR